MPLCFTSLESRNPAKEIIRALKNEKGFPQTHEVFSLFGVGAVYDFAQEHEKELEN